MIPAPHFLQTLRRLSALAGYEPHQVRLLNKLVHAVQGQRFYSLGSDSFQPSSTLIDPDCQVVWSFFCASRGSLRRPQTLLLNFSGRMRPIDFEALEASIQSMRHSCMASERVDPVYRNFPHGTCACLLSLSRPNEQEIHLWVHQDLIPSQAVGLVASGYEDQVHDFDIAISLWGESMH